MEKVIWESLEPFQKKISLELTQKFVRLERFEQICYLHQNLQEFEERISRALVLLVPDTLDDFNDRVLSYTEMRISEIGAALENAADLMSGFPETLSFLETTYSLVKADRDSIISIQTLISEGKEFEEIKKALDSLVGEMKKQCSVLGK